MHPGSRYYDAAMRARPSAAVLAAATLALVAGCGGPSPARTVDVVFTQGSSTLGIHARVASTPSERGEGLMGRRSLRDNEGMLFVFPTEVRVGFYMKDTLIPLDVAFISGTRVVEVRTMTPCTADPCNVTTPAFVYEQALEVDAGTFGRAGISAGAAVHIDGALPKGS
jgi:uncharacterized membrane protein (UPF0127 family)